MWALRAGVRASRWDVRALPCLRRGVPSVRGGVRRAPQRLTALAPVADVAICEAASDDCKSKGARVRPSCLDGARCQEGLRPRAPPRHGRHTRTPSPEPPSRLLDPVQLAQYRLTVSRVLSRGRTRAGRDTMARDRHDG